MSKSEAVPVSVGQAIHQNGQGRVLAIADHQSAGFFRVIRVR